METFMSWVDARHAASEASLDSGFAWLVHVGAHGWVVVPGESIEDAPLDCAAEFIDGVEQ